MKVSLAIRNNLTSTQSYLSGLDGVPPDGYQKTSALIPLLLAFRIFASPPSLVNFKPLNFSLSNGRRAKDFNVYFQNLTNVGCNLFATNLSLIQPAIYTSYAS
jgi:hypothetical protein